MTNDRPSKVRITSGPLKGQTGRILAEWGDGTYLVRLIRSRRLIEMRDRHLRAIAR